MGRISEIPKLKAALAQRMEQLNSQGVGMSDKTAGEIGLFPGLMSPGDQERLREMVKAGLARIDGSKIMLIPVNPVDTVKQRDDRFQADMMAAAGVAFFSEDFPQARRADHSGMNCRTALTEPVEVNRHLLAENERLTRQVADLQADLRKRTTRFDPASRREEPWDPVAELEQVAETLFRSLSSTALMRRYEGYTLKGAIEKVVADLSIAESRLSGLPANADPAECAALLGLKAVKVEPGMLLAIREPGPDSPVPQGAIKRMANVLLSELQKRFGTMTYGAPTVLCIPHGSSLEAVPTSGRGPVQVTIVPEGRPVKPTDCPKHVARAYAEAAAASYGVTPEVVQQKRKSRGLRRAIAARVTRRIASDEPPFITPEVRAERRPLGQSIGWEDPDDLMLADAEV